MRGNEIVSGHRIRCYDNGKTADHFTVVYMDWREGEYFQTVGMSSLPFHPQGVGQHCEAKIGKHLGKRIPFASLPEDCQKLVLQDLEEPNN